MQTVLRGLTYVSLIYPLFGYANPAIGLESPVIPWWLWGATLGIAYLFNYILLRKPRSLLLIILANLVAVGVIGLLPMIGCQTLLVAAWWPAVLPGAVELALLWPVFAYLLILQLPDEYRVVMWEGGLIIWALLLLIADHFSLALSGVWASLILYVGSGLGSEAVGHLKHTSFGEARGFTRLTAIITTIVSILIVGGLAGWLAASSAATNLLKGFGAFLLRLLHALQALIDSAGLNRPAFQPRKLNQPDYNGQLPDSGFLGGPTPLWLMIILWIVLGVTLLALLIMILQWLIAGIREMKQIRIELAQGQVSQFSFRSQWRDLLRGLQESLGKLRKKITDEFLYIRLVRTDNIFQVYALFLHWGKKAGKPRLQNETPSEYVGRLQGLIPEQNCGLASALQDLTEAFNDGRYGGQSSSLPPSEGLQLIKQLRVRLNKLKD